MTELDAERLAARIQRECGADICDPCTVDQGDGVWTVWEFGQEFYSAQDWERFKNWTPEEVGR